MSKYNPVDLEEEETTRVRRRQPKTSNLKRLLGAVDEDDLCRAANGRVWVANECHENSYNFQPLRSAAFRDNIFGGLFESRDCFPSPADWRYALACWEGAARTVKFNPTLRVGGDGRNQILLDNDGGPDSRSGCIEIRPDGWTDHTWGPGDFYRPYSSRLLPNLCRQQTPAFHSLLPIRKLIHAATEADWHRIVIWLLSVLRPRGPYPILVLQGPANSGKTHAARMLRNLFDPAVSPFLPLPGSESRLHSQAHDNYVLAFDHVTTMPRRLSDMLCRLSTGAAANIAGYPQEIERPILLTVPDYANWTPAPGLANRFLVANLTEIPKNQQLLDSEMEERFTEAHRPALRILCDAIAQALTHQAAAGRESDRETWARSAAPILNLTDRDIYEAQKPMRRESPLVPSLVTFLASQPGQSWSGKATDLLEELPEPIRPKNHNELGNRLTRLMPDLTAQGIELIREPTKKARLLHFRLQKPPSPILSPIVWQALSPARSQPSSPAPTETSAPSESQPQIPLSPCHQPPESSTPTPPIVWQPLSPAKSQSSSPHPQVNENAGIAYQDPAPTETSAQPHTPPQIPLSPCHQESPTPTLCDEALDPIPYLVTRSDPDNRYREATQTCKALTKMLATMLEPDKPDDNNDLHSQNPLSPRHQPDVDEDEDLPAGLKEAEQASLARAKLYESLLPFGDASPGPPADGTEEVAAVADGEEIEIVWVDPDDPADPGNQIRRP